MDASSTVSMNLYDYLKLNLSRADPYPAIDHSIRAELTTDGSISFYIHAAGRDSITADYVVRPDGTLVPRFVTGV